MSLGRCARSAIGHALLGLLAAAAPARGQGSEDVNAGQFDFSLPGARSLAMGGAFGRVPADTTAFAHRDRNHFVAVINVWFDTAQDRAPHEAWTAALWEQIRDEGSGVYVNFLEAEGPDRVREAYPHGAYERLQAVKAAYDPQNLFHANHPVVSG